MSDDETTRNRKTEASLGDSEEWKSTFPEMLPKKDIYSRFVSNFENALKCTRLFSRYIHLYVCYSEGRCLKKSKLRAFSLEGIAEYIKTERPCNVIVMSGAGISTSAGIPDFRSPGIFAFVFIFKPTLCHYFVRLLDKKGILRRWFTQDFPKCDLLLIMGTSLVVQPFANLVNEVGLMDVFWGGSCDDGCKRLAELLDWEHELDHLIQEGELRYNSQ
ncbi:unnamed protein product [Angiostrongylus costaricensis]|uniref:Deacetylase sirtuin-type domain-containing protein n=1 Tax=Angiostrongylus costaricensis TaxID=334426 RepID=A0A0R3PWL6_ANGCS|nr:unnamed protein product [Angiostrongylus costaricensis]